jgi:hypothetical protein
MALSIEKLIRSCHLLIGMYPFLLVYLSQASTTIFSPSPQLILLPSLPLCGDHAAQLSFNSMIAE